MATGVFAVFEGKVHGSTLRGELERSNPAARGSVRAAHDVAAP
jgi:hypothetical protein